MALPVDLEHRNSRNTADDKCTAIKRCILCCSYRQPSSSSCAYNDGILFLINRTAASRNQVAPNVAYAACALIWSACHLNFLLRVPLLQNDLHSFKECIASYMLQTSLFATILNYAERLTNCPSYEGWLSNIIPSNFCACCNLEEI